MYTVQRRQGRAGSALRLQIRRTPRCCRNAVYDLQGNLTNIHYSTTNTPDVTFTYDRLGRQKSASDGIGTRSFACDAFLQPTNETMVTAGTDSATNMIARLWDGLGRPIGFTLDADYRMAYGHDSLGRFNALAWSNASSRLLAATYGYAAQADRPRRAARIVVDRGMGLHVTLWHLRGG